MAAWRNGIASDYDWVIRRLQVRPLRWSFLVDQVMESATQYKYECTCNPCHDVCTQYAPMAIEIPR